MNNYISLVLLFFISFSSCSSQYKEITPCELIEIKTVIDIIGADVQNFGQQDLLKDGDLCVMAFEDKEGDDYVLNFTLKQSENESDPILNPNTHFPSNHPDSENIPDLGDNAIFYLVNNEIKAIVVNKSFYTYGIFFDFGKLTELEKRDSILEICEDINSQLN